MEFLLMARDVVISPRACARDISIYCTATRKLTSALTNLEDVLCSNNLLSGQPHPLAFDDYVTLHNSSMLLTYVVTPYHNTMALYNYYTGDVVSVHSLALKVLHLYTKMYVWLCRYLCNFGSLDRPQCFNI